MTDDDLKHYSHEEAAALLGWSSPDALLRAARAKKIPSHKHGRSRVFSREDIAVISEMHKEGPDTGPGLTAVTDLGAITPSRAARRSRKSA
jgi:hypothetical protein